MFIKKFWQRLALKAVICLKKIRGFGLNNPAEKVIS